VDKVVDVVGLYHNPPEKAVVLCVDEKIGSPCAIRDDSFCDREHIPPGRGSRGTQ
jgi:hypothetical protein